MSDFCTELCDLLAIRRDVSRYRRSVTRYLRYQQADLHMKDRIISRNFSSYVNNMEDGADRAC